MLASLLAIPVVVSTTGTSVPPVPLDPAGSSSTSSGGSGSIGEVVSFMWDNITANGYQTAVGLVVATVAIVAMLNIGVHKAVLVPVGLGAFWAGWLGWNTFSGENNPLFPGDVNATKLWDVAFTNDTGFLLVVVVACIAAIFLWRKSTDLVSRIMLLVGAVLGASFVFNLVEAVRDV